MESKLEEYRAKKRRQATINSVKSKLLNMVSFQQVKSEPKHDHVTIEDVDDAKSVSSKSSKMLPKTASEYASESDDVGNAVIPFTDSDEEAAQPAVKEPREKKHYLVYVTYVLYLLFWVTLWTIAIQLQFGVVFLLLSGIFGIYFNTRTGKKSKNEISAYSVFNKDCHSIDGTLKGEQFDKEIRYGPVSVR